VPAKAQDQVGLALGDEVEAVAQVQAGDRTARAAQVARDAAFGRARERDHRPVQLVFDARGEDAHHALVPGLVKERDARARRFGQLAAFIDHRGHRLLQHAAFDRAPLAVERIQLLRAVGRARRVVGDQAFDAKAHVREASRGIEARAHDEAEVERGGLARIASRDLHERHQPRLALARAQPLEAVADQDAVVGVELHHIGHRAKRDEIGERRKVRLAARERRALEHAPVPQLRAQREHHVEHHADPREALARESAARLVGIDDARRGGQFGAGQVMVGDQRGDAERVRMRHALDARDAVVHGDDEVGLFRRGNVDELGREAITELEAVRHEIVDLRAERAQRTDTDRAGRGAVAVVVGHDEDALTVADRIRKQSGRIFGVCKQLGRKEARRVGLQLGD